MSKIAEKTLTFEPSTSPDVVSYKLYYEEVPNEVTYDSPYIDLSGSSVALHEVSEFADFDSTYNMGVSAVDDAGNESDMSKIGDVPLDLNPPLPPTGLTLS